MDRRIQEQLCAAGTKQRFGPTTKDSPAMEQVGWLQGTIEIALGDLVRGDAATGIETLRRGLAALELEEG